MFYRTELKDHIRVPPVFFGMDIQQSVIKAIKQKFDGYIDPEIGIVIDVLGLKEIREGLIIPGDGAAYYETHFEVISFKPELQEVLKGNIKDIADFGAFITLGPMEGMIHISQTMDDFVSFAKDKVLTGKESTRALRVNDVCLARVIAVSFKDVTNPKLGLTMRQQGLGKLEWIEDDTKREEGKKEEVVKKEEPKKEVKKDDKKKK